MIAAEAPVMFAKACELFIQELTLRAWAQTQDNRRRTMQRSDVGVAVSNMPLFDFLVDVVPIKETQECKNYNVRPSLVDSLWLSVCEADEHPRNSTRLTTLAPLRTPAGNFQTISW